MTAGPAVFVAGMLGGAIYTFAEVTSRGANDAGMLALGTTFAGAACAGLWMIWRVLRGQLDRQARELESLRQRAEANSLHLEECHAGREADRMRIAILVAVLERNGMHVPPSVTHGMMGPDPNVHTPRPKEGS